MDTKLYSKIKTDELLMETVRSGFADFPFWFYDERMSMFDFMRIDWHWHTEFEFVYVTDGSVNVSVEREKVHLEKGMGMFINSRRLHFFESEEDAGIPNFLFAPDFAAPEGSRVYSKYVRPIADADIPYIIFEDNGSWTGMVLETMRNIAEHCGTGSELVIFEDCIRLWRYIAENIDLGASKKVEEADAAQTARLQVMMQFIHDNYASAITLDDIAGCAMISKSTALNLFKKYMSITPMEYLISYRLKMACRLLRNTEEKVGAICFETGFASSEYFCRSFRKHYGRTPSEYRNLPHSF